MTSHSVSTDIHLLPGPPPTSIVRKVVELAFEEYRWFQPVWARPWDDEEEGVYTGHAAYKAILAEYEQFQHVMVTDRMERSFLSVYPARREEYPYVGHIAWCVTLTEEMKEGWRADHLHQVVELMRLVGSPLAKAGLSDDHYRKQERFIPNPDGFGTEQTFTLRDPSEGLTGLYWRNFFGPPFVRMFGDRLLSLPPGTRQELGDGLVLVQPYELPTQAMTPEGDAAEERLITVLGPECFYDHQHHRKPTRVPQL